MSSPRLSFLARKTEGKRKDQFNASAGIEEKNKEVLGEERSDGWIIGEHRA